MLVAGFKLPPMMFASEEALALAVGLLATRGLGLVAAASAVASAQAKLERVMPIELRPLVRSVDETVKLDQRPPTAEADHATLVVLSAAARNQRRVRLLYRSPLRHETEREFDPYGLAYRGGRWYVVGMCHLRLGLRSFRLDRVHSVRPVDATFGRPSGFDALRHLNASLATLPRAFGVEVLLETDVERAQRALFPAFGVLESVAEGVRLHGQTDDLDWFALELARLPFRFRIVGPTALRDALRAVAKRLLESAEPSKAEGSANGHSEP
jgi:predicted DNA-binding transcriptional regulator YafY